MRADPKITGLNADMRWALIQAWDLSKTSPGEIGELRSSDGRAMTERELRQLAAVRPNATRAMFASWHARGLCEILPDGCVRFPSLARRQGIDTPGAIRTRAYRTRHSDTEVTRHSDAEPARHSDAIARADQTQTQKNLYRSDPQTKPQGGTATAYANGSRSDPFTVNDTRIPHTIAEAIRRLAIACNDPTAVGPFVALYHQGAPEAAFHDARYALTSLDVEPHNKAAYANRHIRNYARPH
jgi:hypothetical protein